MDFRPLGVKEREELMTALRGNVQNDRALLMDRKTSFVGTADDIPDDEMINAIRSVPTHY